MYLKLKALAGDIPVEILVKLDPCERQPDRHDVTLSVGDSDSGTLATHMDSWWFRTVGLDSLRQALADNADRCQAKEMPDIVRVAKSLTHAALIMVARME